MIMYNEIEHDEGRTTIENSTTGKASNPCLLKIETFYQAMFVNLIMLQQEFHARQNLLRRVFCESEQRLIILMDVNH